jgi:hypothetical protein
MSAGRPTGGEVRLPHQHLPPVGLYQGSSAPSGTGARTYTSRGCVDPKVFGQIDLTHLMQCSAVLWMDPHHLDADPDLSRLVTLLWIRILVFI